MRVPPAGCWPRTSDYQGCDFVRLFLIAALAALVPVSAAAQTPATLQVLGDSSQVLVGRTLQFRAVVRDAGGNQLQNAAVTWSVNNSVFATINSSGLLTARGLGTLRVVALTGAVALQYALGIATLLAVVPVWLGTMHQSIAVLVLATALAAIHGLRRPRATASLTA